MSSSQSSCGVNVAAPSGSGERQNYGAFRVALVDPDTETRRASRIVLSRGNMRVFECEDGASALFLQENQPLDVVLSELELPDMSGERLFDLLTHGPGMVFLTSHGDVERAVSTLRRGAVDLLSKPASPAALLGSVKRAAAGARWRQQVRLRTIDARSRIRRLTSREREVFQLLVQGLGSSRIAAALDIAPQTARVHRSNLMDKLGASSMADLVRLDAAAQDLDPALIRIIMSQDPDLNPGAPGHPPAVRTR